MATPAILLAAAAEFAHRHYPVVVVGVGVCVLYGAAAAGDLHGGRDGAKPTVLMRSSNTRATSSAGSLLTSPPFYYCRCSTWAGATCCWKSSATSAARSRCSGWRRRAAPSATSSAAAPVRPPHPVPRTQRSRTQPPTTARALTATPLLPLQPPLRRSGQRRGSPSRSWRRPRRAGLTSSSPPPGRCAARRPANASDCARDSTPSGEVCVSGTACRVRRLRLTSLAPNRSPRFPARSLAQPVVLRRRGVHAAREAHPAGLPAASRALKSRISNPLHLSCHLLRAPSTARRSSALSAG